MRQHPKPYLSRMVDNWHPATASSWWRHPPGRHGVSQDEGNVPPRMFHFGTPILCKGPLRSCKDVIFVKWCVIGYTPNNWNWKPQCKEYDLIGKWFASDFLGAAGILCRCLCGFWRDMSWLNLMLLIHSKPSIYDYQQWIPRTPNIQETTNALGDIHTIQGIMLGVQKYVHDYTVLYLHVTYQEVEGAHRCW